MIFRGFLKLWKILIFITIFIIFFNEYFIYVFYRWSWNQINCLSKDNCTRILLVADPQILGETFDTNFYNRIAIIDSDRYLRNTFNRATYHVQPDIVCFLGDLMDEGSVATDTEYEIYLQRFKHIFKVFDNNIKTMYVSGDNDIGGERNDVVTGEKVNRFKHGFNEQQYVNVKNVSTLFNINLLTHKYPNVSKSEFHKYSNHQKRIILTHLSLLSYPGLFMDKITSEFKPHIIFSAHIHISKILTYPPTHVQNFIKNSIVTFDLSDINYNQKQQEATYIEIMVPTCSYRMGMDRIGYGMAILENNKLQYTVLWLPKRFQYLYIYLIWFSFIVLTLICLKLINNYKTGKRWYYRNNSFMATRV